MANNKWAQMLIIRERQDEMTEELSRCPACGEPIDYCQGHGEFGDAWGFAILELHDEGDHSQCHPDGCEEAKRV